MSLLTRVKERVESDLSDGELQNLIDEAQAEIARRYGPAAAAGQITVTVEGRTRRIDLVRPLDTGQPHTVTEHVVADVLDVEAASDADQWVEVGDVATVLAADDYRVWNGGRTLERLFTGTHARTRWGARVDVVYTPVADNNQRDEVTIKLVALAVEYEGVVERRIGDTSVVHALRGGGGGTIYQGERETLLLSLQPRGGLFLR